MKRRNRADLKSDREYEQNQSEFAYEFKDVFVDDISEVSHQDAHKEHEGDAERHTANLQFADENAAAITKEYSTSVAAIESLPGSRRSVIKSMKLIHLNH